MGVYTDLGILAVTKTETQLHFGLSLKVVWILCNPPHPGKTRIPSFDIENNFRLSQYEAEVEFIKHRKESAEGRIKHTWSKDIGFSKMSWNRPENWQTDFGGSPVTLLRVPNIQQRLKVKAFSVVNRVVKYIYEGLLCGFRNQESARNSIFYMMLALSQHSLLVVSVNILALSVVPVVPAFISSKDKWILGRTAPFPSCASLPTLSQLSCFFILPQEWKYFKQEIWIGLHLVILISWNLWNLFIKEKVRCRSLQKKDQKCNTVFLLTLPGRSSKGK